MRILLATDGSEHSEAAVDEIAHWNYPADSEVRVISVVETLMPLSAESLPTSAGYHGELEKIERESGRGARIRKRPEDSARSSTEAV